MKRMNRILMMTTLGLLFLFSLSLAAGKSKGERNALPLTETPFISIEKVFLKDDIIRVILKKSGKGDLSPKDLEFPLLLQVGQDNPQSFRLPQDLRIKLNTGKDVEYNTGIKLVKRSMVSASFPATRTSKGLKTSVELAPMAALQPKDRATGSHVTRGTDSLTPREGAAGGRSDVTSADTVIGGPAASSQSLANRTASGNSLAEASGPMRKAPQPKQEFLGFQRQIEGIIIERPIRGTSVRAGDRATIRWRLDDHALEKSREGWPMSVTLYARSAADPGNIPWTFTAGSNREVDWHIPSGTTPGTYIIGARWELGSMVYTGSTHIEVLSSSGLVLLWPPEAGPGKPVLYVGTNYPIRWNAYGEADGRRYNIMLLMDGVRSFDAVALNINPPSMSFDWVVGGNCSRPSTVPQGENFRIKLTTAGGAPIFEALSAPIAIRLPTISMSASPRSGDRWRIGSRQTIQWNNDHVPDGSRVTLRLLKDGRDYFLIDENQPNTGSFVWEEAGVEKYIGPVTNRSIARREAEAGTNYTIKIELVNCPAVYGISPVFELYR